MLSWWSKRHWVKQFTSLCGVLSFINRKHERKHEMKQKTCYAINGEKIPCQSPFHCLNPLKQKWPITKNQLMVCANCRGHSCQNTYQVDSIAVWFVLQEPLESGRGHDVSSLVRCWTLARRLCLLLYLFIADISFAFLSFLLSFSCAFGLGACSGQFKRQTHRG